MKTMIQIETVTLTCPHCGTIIPNASGSTVWTVSEVQEAPKQLICKECNGASSKPSIR